MDELMKLYQREQAKKEAKRAWMQTEEGKAYNRQKAKEFYERNREKVLQQRKEYYEKNLEMMRERNKIAHQKWKEEHPDLYEARRQRLREQKAAKKLEG